MIPYGRQSIDEDDIAAVVDVLRGDYLTQGPAVAAFETALTERFQSHDVVACNSGTAALHMAYAAVGIGPGDVVVVPANTFLATANAAVYLGAQVRFCDVDPMSGLMTPKTLEPALDGDVRLVVPVHFAGMPCDMAAIGELVRSRSPHAVIIEDASHAIGATHRCGTPVGNLKYASMATFSFHPVKHIAAGEGGAVSCDGPKIAKRLREFRCHGMTKDRVDLTKPDEGPWYYEMHRIGMNYRIPDLSCALALSQLSKLDAFIGRRRAIADRYRERLSGLRGIELPDACEPDGSAWHLFCLHIDFENTRLPRESWMMHLRKRGVGTQVHYFPVSDQPYYSVSRDSTSQKATSQDSPSHEPTSRPGPTLMGAREHYRTALSLPMYPGMSDTDHQTVCEAVRQVHRLAHGGGSAATGLDQRAA